MKVVFAVVVGWVAAAVTVPAFGLSWITPLYAIAVTMAMYYAAKLRMW
jgi:hypothetical protein